jgi:nucleotide-binding universal stress UspA family protein
LFSKILVPVDGSSISYKALDTALFLANKTGSEITVVHVLESVPTTYIELKNTLEMDTTKGQVILDRCSEFAKQRNISINTALLQGSPSSTILNFAVKEKFDVIAIGSHGISGFKERLLGSVSNKIVHFSSLPVLLIK